MRVSTRKSSGHLSTLVESMPSEGLGREATAAHMRAVVAGAEGIVTYSHTPTGPADIYIWIGYIPRRGGRFIIPNGYAPSYISTLDHSKIRYGKGLNHANVKVILTSHCEIDEDENFEPVPLLVQANWLDAAVVDGFPMPHWVLYTGNKSLQWGHALRAEDVTPESLATWVECQKMQAALFRGDHRLVSLGHKMRLGGHHGVAHDGSERRQVLLTSRTSDPYGLQELHDGLSDLCSRRGVDFNEVHTALKQSARLKDASGKAERNGNLKEAAAILKEAQRIRKTLRPAAPGPVPAFVDERGKPLAKELPPSVGMAAVRDFERHYVDRNTFSVTLEHGGTRPLSEIEAKPGAATQRCFCPSCPSGKRAAGLVIVGERVQVLCFRCQVSWISRPTVLVDPVQLGFLSKTQNVPQSLKVFVVKEDSGTKPPGSASFEELNQEHLLPYSVTKDGVLYIFSGCGTGKDYTTFTTVLPEYLAQYPGSGVLVIVARQRLADVTFARYLKKLGFRLYSEPGTGLANRVVCCLDSLHKFAPSNVDYDASDGGDTNPPHFDLVIVNESEETLGHLTGQTIQVNGRVRNWNALSAVLPGAKHVVCMDANLGPLTVGIMRRVLGGSSAPTERLICNRYTKTREALLYDDLDHIRQAIFVAAASGKKVAIGCSRKQEVSRLTADLTQMGTTVLAFKGDGLWEKAHTKFMEDPNAYIDAMSSGAIIFSPVLSSGVSIEAPVDEFFLIGHTGLFTSPLQLFQQLHRFRNPGNMHIWVQNHAGAVRTRDDIRAQYASGIEAQGADLRRVIGKEAPSVDGRLVETLVDIDHRGSLSREDFRYQFLELLESRGYVLESPAPQGEQDAATSNPPMPRKQETAAKLARDILTADDLSEDDYRGLPARRHTREQQLARKKYALKCLLGYPPSEQDCLDYVCNKLEESIARYVALMVYIGAPTRLAWTDAYQRRRTGPVARPDMRMARLVFIALKEMGLDLERDPVEWPKTRLAISDSGRKRLQVMAGAYKEVLGISCSSAAFLKNPGRFMSTILRRLGLKLHSKRIGKGSGRGGYTYSISAQSIELMERRSAHQFEQLRHWSEYIRAVGDRGRTLDSIPVELDTRKARNVLEHEDPDEFFE